MKIGCGIQTCWKIVPILLLTVSIASGDDPEVDPQTKLPDTLLLKSGGTLTGKIEKEIKDESGKSFVVFRTESGGLLKLDTDRLIKKNGVRPADEIDAEYQRRLKICGDQPDLLWKLYQWCDEQPSGAIRFREELKFLLRRIVELDPTDERARRSLGYQQVDGQWVMKSQLFAGHGYLKQGTGWAPEMQTQIEADYEARRRAEGERKGALRGWLKEVRKGQKNSAQLTQELFQICDALAVPIILEQEAKKEENPELRAIYIEAFGRVPTFAANQALCYFAIQDPVLENRERAVTLLRQDHFNHAASVQLIAPALGANGNIYVKRAAFAIGELGQVDGVLPLATALETIHKVAIPGSEPGRMNSTFSNNGISSFQMGGGPTSKNEPVRNPEALAALRKITEQDFGYDKQAWQNWFLENHTHYNINVREDD